MEMESAKDPKAQRLWRLQLEKSYVFGVILKTTLFEKYFQTAFLVQTPFGVVLVVAIPPFEIDLMESIATIMNAMKKEPTTIYRKICTLGKEKLSVHSAAVIGGYFKSLTVIS